MFGTLRALSLALRLLATDENARLYVARPILKSGIVYFIFLAATIFLSILWASLAFGEVSIAAEIIGGFLFILLVPILASFLYFTFFCEKQFLEITELVLGTQQKQETQSAKKYSRTFPYILLVALPILLILSFFIPPLSFALGGMFFAMDVLSYPLENKGYSFGEKISFCFQHIAAFFFLGLVFAFGMFIPFGVIFLYPIGVLVGSYFIQDKIA